MDLLLFAALIWQFVDFLRELTNLPATKSSVVTQLTAWTAGVALVALAAQAEVSAGLTLPGIDTPLGALDGWSTLLVGLMAASVASSLVDVKQAVDSNDSASKPPLLH